MIYKIIGWWVRWQACKMAALLASGRNERADEGIVPMVWSVTVFFESYMLHGAEGTREDFGPTQPVKLEEVKRERGAQS